MPLGNNSDSNYYTSEKVRVSEETIKQLKEEIIGLSSLNPQERGRAFERFLQNLFDAYRLKPKAPFRLRGEQIDGSIELEGHTYLIEAKWTDKPVGIQELLAFKGKIGSKATWSRGLFISYSGVTEGSIEAFSKGGPTNLIVMTAEDLWAILDEEMDLGEAIKLKSRHAAETGNILIRVYELKSMYKIGRVNSN